MKGFTVTCMLLITAIFCGCSNYQELNEFDIVAGMAVDNTENGYRITLEIVDNEGSLQDGLSSCSVTLEGETVPKALDNAESRFSKKFHFGNMQVIIISQEIARQEGLQELLDFFLRNLEIRETIQIMISTDKTASAILNAQGVDAPIASYALEEIVKPPSKNLSHTKQISIYSAFNILNTSGQSLVLPCVKTWKSENGKSYVEVFGLAAFSGGYLKRILPEQDVNYYLYATDQSLSHEYVFSMPNSADRITLNISKSSTGRSFTVQNGVITFSFDILAYGAVSNIPENMNIEDPKTKAAIEKAASEIFCKNTSALLESYLYDSGIDLAYMGYDIYLHSQEQWELFKAYLDYSRSNIKIKVNANIKINHSGTIRST